MARRTAAQIIHKTRNFDFIFGHYSISDKAVPYFQISMTFDDAASYLTLIDEMPGSSSMDWRIEELFQRDIDWDRVERGLVPYLQAEDRPQFFNSITIALIPRKDDALYGFDSHLDWHAPHLDSPQNFEDGKIVNFGPLRCGYFLPWQSYQDDEARVGQLAWNSDEMVAVAIDGQHRLAGIKEVASSLSGSGKKSSVPVILVVLDSRLGFNGGHDYGTTLQTLRRLFIDLNKHARTVKRARQILLDDREPVSLCVRALVGSQLVKGDSELNSSPPRLPLTLVDWHSEQAKFDEGPYLTTILGLDWVVSQLLLIKPMESGVDYDAIRRAIDKIHRATNVDLSAARERLGKDEDFERPFSFGDGTDPSTDDELRRISEGFSENWSRPIVTILTEFAPYGRLIEMREASGTLTAEFANWNALRSQADNAKGKVLYLKNRLSRLQKELQNRSHHPVSITQYENALKDLKELKGDYELAFTVVFQRASVMAFNVFNSVTTNMVPYSDVPHDFDIAAELAAVEEGAEEDTDDEILADASGSVALTDERARQLVSALNKILEVEPDFLKKGFEYHPAKGSLERFWHSSFAHPDGTIDFTQSASKRASDLILCAALFHLVLQTEGQMDFDELYSRIEDATSGLYLKLSQAQSRMCRDAGIADRILKARDDDDRSEANRKAQIRTRLKWIWDTLTK